MGSREMRNALTVVALPLLLGSLAGSPAIAQSPTYGVGRTPTADELRRMDISISPEGDELPVGSGSAKEGAVVYVQKACVGCHGVGGIGGAAPVLRSERGADVPVWQKERILPLRSPYATTVWDFINRGMPVGLEGTLTPNEVYALTAYLLFINNVIPEDQVLDKESLPQVTMPIGDEFGKPHEFKPNAPRLKGYPY
jgi:mono/diheme cytochrome c family protein